MMNSGESLFTSAPRDPYTVAIRKIASALADDPRTPLKPIEAGSGWLNQLTSRFKTT